MKYIPILFSTPMVQAIMEDRKTMTRRIVKPQPEAPRAIYHENESIAVIGTKDQGSEGLLRFNWRTERFAPKIIQDAGNFSHKCPYGNPGDILWVRETWKPKSFAGNVLDGYDYKADHVTWLQKNGMEFKNGSGCETGEVWKPSLFMPKAACRLLLEITDVRVERLQDISEEDAKAEGVSKDCPIGNIAVYQKAPYGYCFSQLWEQINGPESWEANPFVWVISFKKVERPEGFK